MAKTNPRVDAYIAKSASFARPILQHLRALVHAGCPEVAETMKWSTPHFMYKGMLCGMAAFREHCAFGFWNGAMNLPADRAALGQFGRITALGDLPKDTRVVDLVKMAARLNETGIKRPPIAKRPKPKLTVPAYFRAALKKTPRALATFEQFSTSHKREYVEWLSEAKTDETRARRLRTAIEWIANGKSRNWKYVKR